MRRLNFAKEAPPERDKWVNMKTKWITANLKVKKWTKRIEKKYFYDPQEP